MKKYCMIDCFGLEHYFDSIVTATVEAYKFARWLSHSNLCDGETGEVLATFENHDGSVVVSYE